MTIANMHDMVKSLKNQGQLGYSSPEEIDRALNNASDSKFNEEKRAFEVNQYISSNLSLFKKKAEVTITTGSGPLPADYDYATNASLSDESFVEIVPESEWVERINDPIDTPDADRPICSIRATIEVRPTSVASINLYYLKQPATMLYAYTADDDGNITQNTGSSVSCDWPVKAHQDIVLRALVELGVPVNDETLIRFKAYKMQTEKV